MRMTLVPPVRWRARARGGGRTERALEASAQERRSAGSVAQRGGGPRRCQRAPTVAGTAVGPRAASTPGQAAKSAVMTYRPPAAMARAEAMGRGAFGTAAVA